MRRILLFLLTLAASWTLAAGDAETMLAKARRLVLPTLQYRETTVKDILEDIRARSEAADAQHEGVSFLVKLDEKTAGRRITMTIGRPTVERALSLLAATVELYIQYDTSAIVVQKSERVVGAK